MTPPARARDRRARDALRLRRRSALLQSVLDGMAEGLGVFDRDGRLIASNRRFCKLLDLPAVTLGTQLSDILMRQAARGDFGAVAPESEVGRRIAEFYRVPQLEEHVTATGRIVQVRRSALPEGAVLCTYSDITELKNSENKLIEARLQAEAASKTKSDFLANMSHELRTPLNAMIGFTEIIGNQIFGAIENGKYLEYIKDIHNSSLHLLSIINDVLDMSRIEAGSLALAKQPLRLQSVAAGALRVVRERASRRGIAIIAEFAAKDLVIRADERAMRQVFLNLLDNAVKFSREGGTICLRLARGGSATAIVEIEDHGLGMTVEEQERALEPFGQAQMTTSRAYGGTGLGLPISRGLVEAHGGRLAITSRPGQGTTVRLELPAAEERPPAPVRPEDAAAE